MIQDILRKTMPEPKPAQELDNLGIDWAQARLEHSVLTRPDDGLFHLLRNFVDHLFNASGMDAAIEEQPLHGLAGDLAPNRIEPRKDNGIRRIVDQDGDPSGSFKSANVASFPANNAPLKFFIRKGDGGAGRFESVLARVTLDCQTDNAPGFFLRPHFGLFENAPGKIAGVLQTFQFDLFEDHLPGFGHGELAHNLESFAPFLDKTGQRGALSLELLDFVFALQFLFTKALFFVDPVFKLMVNEGLAFHEPFLSFD